MDLNVEKQVSSDIEFLRARLAIVEQRLRCPDSASELRADGEWLRQSDRRHREINYRREARLLCKLIARAQPGKAVRMLTAWRDELGQIALAHRNQTKEIARV